MQRHPLCSVRINRELEKILQNPPPGISLFRKEDSFDLLDANVMGMEGTPYESGVFNLEMQIPNKYPIEPPRVRFITRVYHPNIDDAGRICLDLLRLPPKGSWRPVNTLEGLLIAIQQLLTYPNPDDPLMADIAEEYRTNRLQFDNTARKWTRTYAFQNNAQATKQEETAITCEEKTNKQKKRELESDHSGSKSKYSKPNTSEEHV